jgi:hypothetical protein
VVVGAADTLYLTKGAPLTSGAYTQQALQTLPGYQQAVQLVDVNGDGKLDLLVAYASVQSAATSGLYVYLNNGTSTPFSSTPLIVLAGQNVDTFYVADLNLDGRPDLIVAGSTPITEKQLFLSVSLNTGSKTAPFGAPQPLAVDANAGSPCFDVKEADLNGDGLPDLLLACNGVDVVYLNQGTSSPFAGAAPIELTGYADLAIAGGPVTKAGAVDLFVGGPDDALFAVPVIVQRAPVTSNDAATCRVDTPCAISVLANDRASPGSSLNASSLHVTVGPAHGTTQVDTTTGVVNYTPVSGFVGQDSFQYAVSDSQGNPSNVSTVSIVVEAVPVANDDTAGIQDGSSVTIGVTNNDTSVFGTLDQTSIKIVSPAMHGTTTTSYGAVTYTPAAGYLGLDTFKYTVANTQGTVSNAATVTVSVSSPATTGVPVNLLFNFNVFAVESPGQAVRYGGLDGHGYGYDASLLGFTINWAGTPFSLDAASTDNGVTGDGSLLPVTPGKYSALKIVGSAVNGAQLNQKLVLHYAGTGSGTTQTVLQSFSDWGKPQNFPGETVVSTLAERVTPTGTLQAGAWRIYGYTIPVDPTRTLQSVQLPVNRDVIVLGMNLSPVTSAAPVPVAFTKANAYAVRDAGDKDPVGLDGAGNDYAGELLGDSVVWSGVPFQMPATGPLALSRTKQTLPGGNYSKLYLLGTGWKGAQQNQPVVIAYADGSMETVIQSFSDWGEPQHYAGESIAKTMAYRYRSDGSEQAGSWNLYGYTINLDKTKVVASITLPNVHVTVLAMTLAP